MDDREELRELMRRAQYVDAFSLVGGAAGIRREVDTERSLLHARLAHHLGEHRLGAGLTRRMFRLDPKHPGVVAAAARWRLPSRGPISTLDWIAAHPVDFSRGHAIDRADHAVVRAMAHARLRDEVGALRCVAEAEEAAPDAPWPRTARVNVYELLDRRREALELARVLAAAHPEHRATFQSLVELCVAEEGFEAGLTLLRERAQTFQSFSVSMQHAATAMQLRELEEVDEAFARARAQAALPSPQLVLQLDLFEFQLAYLRGQRERARSILEGVDSKWMSPEGREKLGRQVERLRAVARVPDEVRLAVPYVRQAHNTCAPASLTAVARYLGQGVEHDEVVDAICFAGTPLWRQRAWAESRGFEVVSFDGKPDAIRAFLDAGIPVGLVTNGAASSHLQVIVGHDRVIEVWLVMDPSRRGEVLLEIESVEKQEGWNGPEALVLLPPDRRDVVALVQPPSVAARARATDFDRALDEGRLVDAEETLASIAADDPEHRVRWQCELRLAATLADFGRQRRALDALRALDTDVRRYDMILAELLALSGAPFDVRAAHLEKFRFDSEPALLTSYGELELYRPGGRARAERALRRAHALDPMNSRTIMRLAELAQLENDRERVARLARWASLVDPRSTWATATYFDTSRLLGREDEALDFLRARVVVEEEAAVAENAIRLFESYEKLGRQREGIGELVTLAKERPEEGALALACANAYLATNEPEEARRWLAEAEGRSNPRTWTQSRARLLVRESKLDEAVTVLGEALAQHPDAFELFAYRVEIVALQRGAHEAARLVAEQLRNNPDDVRAFDFAAGFVRDDPTLGEQLVQDRLARHPEDIPALQRLAQIATQTGRPEFGLETAERALALDPDQASSWRVRGQVHLELRHRDAAEADLREALARNPDDPGALAQLLVAIGDPERERALLREQVARLEASSSTGDGVSALSRSLGRFSAHEALAIVERLRDRFPFLIDAHLALIGEALERGQTDVAAAAIAVAQARFPEHPDVLRLEMALHRELGRYEESLALARRLHTRAPLGDLSNLDVALDLRALGRNQEAEALLRDAMKTPAPWLKVRLQLARWLRSAHRFEEALEVLVAWPELVGIEYSIWLEAANVAEQLDDLSRVTSVVRARCEEVGDSAAWWRLLGELSVGPERLGAFERALAIDPTNDEAADAIAQYHADLGDHDRAYRFLPPLGWKGEVPVTLRGRRAWVRRLAGDGRGAIAEMKQVVERHPDYLWGIENLIRWAREDEDAELHEWAARARLENAPDDPISLTELAQAIRAARGAEAAELLARAVRLRPRDGGILALAAEVMVEVGELDGLATLLQEVGERASPGVRVEARARLLVAQGEPMVALAQLESLFDEAIGIEDARAFAAVFVGNELMGYLGELVVRACTREPPPASVDAWSELSLQLVRRKHVRHAETLWSRRAEVNEAGRLAIADYVEQLGLERGPANDERLRSFLKHKRELKDSPVLWASAGRAMVDLGRKSEAFHWMRDFHARDGVRPWMLVSHVANAWDIGRLISATECAMFGVQLPPDGTTVVLAGWARLGCAALGWELPEVARSPHLPQQNAYPYAVGSLILEGRALLAQGALDPIRTELEDLVYQTVALHHPSYSDSIWELARVTLMNDFRAMKVTGAVDDIDKLMHDAIVARRQQHLDAGRDL